MNLSVIILTYNEEIHIERCISSVLGIADEIFVVDSFSHDRTCILAKKSGARVYKKKWPGNHSEQFNWALENCSILTKWVMRLDADEIISIDLAKEIKAVIASNGQEKGFVLNRGHIFLGKKMLHGDNFPIKLLRIWEHGFAYCEDKLMDEHIILKDDYIVKQLHHPFWDNNLNNISWWIEKHNSYASKEALMQLRNKYGKKAVPHKINLRRFLKYSVYEKLPKSIRAFLFFCYRYILRFGFLDGYEGLVWNFLQAFWYRFLVDVKVYEIEKKAKKSGMSIEEFLKLEHGFEI